MIEMRHEKRKVICNFQTFFYFVRKKLPLIDVMMEAIGNINLTKWATPFNIHTPPVEDFEKKNV